MANNNNKLTPRQNKAIGALLNAPDKKAAAELAGVGYRSLNRWLKDDYFIAELQRAEVDLISAAIRGLVGDLDKNLATMREIRDHPRTPVNVKLRAAQVIDQSLIKWREALDIEQRLVKLEKAVLNGK